MVLFHGSNVAGIKLLEPRQADHDRPYIYFATIEVVAALYMCNAVEKPYYWFPYGFENGKVDQPVYHELFSGAFKEMSDNVQGFIYKVDAKDNQVIPFKNIPCARLGIEPIEVTDCIEVNNAYELFQEYINQGKLKVSRYEDKSKEELENWYNMILQYLKQKEMYKIPDCSYAMYVKDKFPFVWERYLTEVRKDIL